MKRRRWTVGRTWCELTKLVLRGCGGYDLYLRVDDLDADAQDEFNKENWSACRLTWEDRRDHFAILSADPESGGAR